MDTCTFLVITVLFVTGKFWRQAKYPVNDGILRQRKIMQKRMKTVPLCYHGKISKIDC